MRFKVRTNKKTQFTRMCIAEAIIQLLHDIPYEKLRVSSIVKRAGVARMTFYKYYDSPKAALMDYMDIIISDYIEKSPAEHNRAAYMSKEHILYSLNYFDQYKDYFLTLAHNGLYSIMIDSVNRFMTDHIQISNHLSQYQLYSYAGGLLNTFLKWEEEGKSDSAEEIAEMVYYLYSDHT